MLGFQKHLSGDIIFSLLKSNSRGGIEVVCGASPCSHCGFNSGTEMTCLLLSPLLLLSFLLLYLSITLNTQETGLKYRNKVDFHAKMSSENSGQIRSDIVGSVPLFKLNKTYK